MRNFCEHLPIKLKPCVSILKLLGCGGIGTMFCLMREKFRVGPHNSSPKARSAPLQYLGGCFVPTEQAGNCQCPATYHL